MGSGPGLPLPTPASDYGIPAAGGGPFGGAGIPLTSVVPVGGSASLGPPGGIAVPITVASGSTSGGGKGLGGDIFGIGKGIGDFITGFERGVAQSFAKLTSGGGGNQGTATLIAPPVGGSAALSGGIGGGIPLTSAALSQYGIPASGNLQLEPVFFRDGQPGSVPSPDAFSRSLQGPQLPQIDLNSLNAVDQQSVSALARLGRAHHLSSISQGRMGSNIQIGSIRASNVVPVATLNFG